MMARHLLGAVDMWDASRQAFSGFEFFYSKVESAPAQSHNPLAGRVGRQHNRRSYYVSFLVNHGKCHNFVGNFQQTIVAIFRLKTHE